MISNLSLVLWLTAKVIRNTYEIIMNVKTTSIRLVNSICYLEVARVQRRSLSYLHLFRLLATTLFDLPLTLNDLTALESELKSCAVALYGLKQVCLICL